MPRLGLVTLMHVQQHHLSSRDRIRVARASHIERGVNALAVRAKDAHGDINDIRF